MLKKYGALILMLVVAMVAVKILVATVFPLLGIQTAWDVNNWNQENEPWREVSFELPPHNQSFGKATFLQQVAHPYLGEYNRKLRIDYFDGTTQTFDLPKNLTNETIVNLYWTAYGNTREDQGMLILKDRQQITVIDVKNRTLLSRSALYPLDKFGYLGRIESKASEVIYVDESQSPQTELVHTATSDEYDHPFVSQLGGYKIEVNGNKLTFFKQDTRLIDVAYKKTAENDALLQVGAITESKENKDVLFLWLDNKPAGCESADDTKCLQFLGKIIAEFEQYGGLWMYDLPNKKLTHVAKPPFNSDEKKWNITAKSLIHNNEKQRITVSLEYYERGENDSIQKKSEEIHFDLENKLWEKSEIYFSR